MHDPEPKIDPMRQDNIWRHFQNQHPEVFEGARARMDVIIRDIARRKGSSVPRVLNIGVGNGYLETVIKALGWLITSLDPDENAVDGLREKGISAHRGRMENMPFSDESFDFVIASEVLEHLNDEQLQRGLDEVKRVLAGGGWFIGTVPYCEDLVSNEVICPRCHEVFHRWGHQRSFDVASMQKVLRFGFNAVFTKRRAFVGLRRKSLKGKLKGVIRLILAHYGVGIAVPSIYFLSKK